MVPAVSPTSHAKYLGPRIQRGARARTGSIATAATANSDGREVVRHVEARVQEGAGTEGDGIAADLSPALRHGDVGLVLMWIERPWESRLVSASATSRRGAWWF